DRDLDAENPPVTVIADPDVGNPRRRVKQHERLPAALSVAADQIVRTVDAGAGDPPRAAPLAEKRHVAVWRHVAERDLVPRRAVPAEHVLLARGLRRAGAEDDVVAIVGASPEEARLVVPLQQESHLKHHLPGLAVVAKRDIVTIFE